MGRRLDEATVMQRIDVVLMVRKASASQEQH
jgi:hypothetical protein